MSEDKLPSADIPDWIVRDSGGDEVLISLMLDNEWLIHWVNERRGTRYLSSPEAAEVLRIKRCLENGIIDRKRELGYLPPEQT
jgi:hypothetical protein